MTKRKCFQFVSGLILASAFIASANAQSSAALSGVVSSDAEGHMEGVLVTATPDGGNVTTTVISNEQGRYSFPAGRLKPGKYSLSIRAVGYDLPGPISLDVASGKPGHADIKLVKAKDLASQLTGAEWMMSVPGDENQKRALFHCDQCHSLDHVVESTYDVNGWHSTLLRMQQYWVGNSTYDHPVPPPASRKRKEDPVDPELAKYLSTVNLSDNRPTWTYELKTMPRPRGKDTHVIITEYILSRPGVAPHDVGIDPQGKIWYSDFRSPYIGRLDPTTGKDKEWMLPLLKPGFPEWTLNIEVDKQGNPWLPRFYQGCAETTLDVKTEKFRTVSVPAEYNGPNAFCSQGSNIAADGMVWFYQFRGPMFQLDTKSGEVRVFDAYPGMPKEPAGASPLFYFGVDDKFGGRNSGTHGSYGISSDPNGNAIYCDMGASSIATLDASTGKVEIYPTPTPEAGPRRGSIDPLGRFWFGEWMASQLGMFDPKTKEIKEWKPPAPWSGLYRAAADKNGNAWAGGMSTDYVYHLNSKTGEWRQYLLPTLGGEIRDVKIDDSGPMPKVWVPLLDAGIIAKVEPLD